MAISIGGGEVVLRCAVTLLSMFSLTLLVRDRQAILQSVGLTSVVSQLTYSDSTGLVDLVYSNGLVAIYSVVVAFTSFFKSLRSSKSGAWVLFVLDQILAYTLLSAASAATEIQYLLKNGDTKTTWDRKCNVFGHFCHVLEGSIIGSFIAVILLAVICILSAKQLFQQYTRVGFVTSNKYMPNSIA